MLAAPADAPLGFFAGLTAEAPGCEDALSDLAAPAAALAMTRPADHGRARPSATLGFFADVSAETRASEGTLSDLEAPAAALPVATASPADGGARPSAMLSFFDLLAEAPGCDGTLSDLEAPAISLGSRAVDGRVRTCRFFASAEAPGCAAPTRALRCSTGDNPMLAAAVGLILSLTAAEEVGSVSAKRWYI